MTAQLLDMPAVVYHARGEISQSRLKVFRDSPRLYEGYYITGKWTPPPPTADMEDGMMIHLGILEGGIGKSVVEIPRDALNKDGHRKGSAWDAWSAQCDAPYARTLKELEGIKRAIDAVLSDESVQGFLDSGTKEKSVFWTHEETALACRSRIDCLCHGLILDVKSTKSAKPEDFAWDCRKLRYDWQAAFYIDAVGTSTGEACDFAFIAVEKKPPYRVRLIEVDQEDVRSARGAVNAAMQDLARRLASGDWSEREEPQNAGFITVKLPKDYSQDWSLA